MNVLQRVAKNTLAMALCNVVSLITGFAYAAYTARYLGPDRYGTIGTAIALTSLFSFISDLGLNQLMIRDIARNRGLAKKYVGNIILIKLILTVLTFSAISLVVNILGYTDLTTSVIYLMTLYISLNAFNSIFNSLFQAYEKMEYLALSSIINSVLMLAGAFVVVSYGSGVIGFALIYVSVSLICLLYGVGVLYFKFFKPGIEVDLKFWRPTISEALTFGLNGLFVSLYYWSAPVMLSYSKGSEAVGWYNAAFRLILILLFLPTIMSITLFPLMSQFYVVARDNMQFAYLKNFKYMAMLAIPMGVGTTLLADQIILMIFGGGFINSAAALRVLVWSAVFIFLSSASTVLLQSSNKQRTLVKITSLCAVINITINVLLIPQYSYLGSSAAAAITEFSALVLVIASCADLGYSLLKNSFYDLVKIAIASSFMAVIVVLLKDLSLIILIPLSATIYFVALYMINGFEAREVEMFKSVLRYMIDRSKD